MKFVLAFLIALLPTAVFAWTHGISSISSPTGIGFADVPIGAGGVVNGIAFETDGTRLIRSDVGGCWIWRVGDTRWRELITTASMPAGVPDVDQGLACFEIAYAKTNLNHLYIYFRDTVYSSLNKGVTWNATAFPVNPVNSNGKVFGSATMAVDPINESVVYVGVPQVGVYSTTDGGAHWAFNPTITPGGSVENTSMANLVLFDPSSGTTGGKTNGIYIQSYGVGVYHSTNAGGTWTLMPSSPLQVRFWGITSAGKIYLTQTGPNSGLMYSGSTWTSFTSGIDTIGEGPGMPAIDPTNETHVAMVGLGGSVSMSVDSGGHWSTPGPNTAVTYISPPGDIPWLGWSYTQPHAGENFFCDCAQAAFDNTGTNTLSGNGRWGDPSKPHRQQRRQSTLVLPIARDRRTGGEYGPYAAWRVIFGGNVGPAVLQCGPSSLDLLSDDVWAAGCAGRADRRRLGPRLSRDETSDGGWDRQFPKPQLLRIFDRWRRQLGFVRRSDHARKLRGDGRLSGDRQFRRHRHDRL